MSPLNFLCYGQAYRKRKAGKITEEEYFKNVLQHLVWEHECQDDLDDNDSMGYVIEYVCVGNTQLINGRCRRLATSSRLTTTETKPFEEAFLAFRRGSKDDFESNLSKVTEENRAGIRKGLAHCALRERDVKTLKWMLDGCRGPMGEAFTDLAYVVRKQRSVDRESAELLKVVGLSHFEVPQEWKVRKSMHPPGNDLR